MYKDDAGLRLYLSMSFFLNVLFCIQVVGPDVNGCDDICVYLF